MGFRLKGQHQTASTSLTDSLLTCTTLNGRPGEWAKNTAPLSVSRPYVSFYRVSLARLPLFMASRWLSFTASVSQRSSGSGNYVFVSGPLFFFTKVLGFAPYIIVVFHRFAQCYEVPSSFMGCKRCFIRCLAKCFLLGKKSTPETCNGLASSKCSSITSKWSLYTNFFLYDIGIHWTSPCVQVARPHVSVASLFSSLAYYRWKHSRHSGEIRWRVKSKREREREELWPTTSFTDPMTLEWAHMDRATGKWKSNSIDDTDRL